VKSIRPIFNLIRGAWLDFLLRTVDPLAPHLPEMVIERDALKDSK
jgi:hypothetical protein